MTARRSNDTLGPSGDAGARCRLLPGAAGAFRLATPDPVRVDADGEGWSVRGGAFPEGTRLLPTDDGLGVRLVDADRRELGRTSSLTGATIAEDPRSVLLEDGRLFRLVQEERGYALLGWETSGALVRWDRDGNGWQGHEEPAGAALEGGERLSLLCAAAILADDRDEETR